jgi:ribosomal protein L32
MPSRTPQLALLQNPSVEPISSRASSGPSLSDCIWLAVPKRKVTPGKKRMKTTIQNRIKAKDHVIVDKRTGEPTLRHKLPFNWKDYLPGNTPKSS